MRDGPYTKRDGDPINVAANSIYPSTSQWQYQQPRLVMRDGAVALTVPEIVSLVQEGIIKAEQAAELLGFKPDQT